VNLAPTQGVGGPGLLGTCVVSDSLVLQLGSSSTPGQLRLEQAANVEGAGQSSSAPDPRPLGHRVYIPMARKTLLEMLSESAKSGRAPLLHDILTWMDAEHPRAEVNKHYMDSSSDFQAFGIHNAFDIMESNVCHLATFGELGRGGAMRLHKYTRNKILIPLDLWATNTEFTGTGTDHLSTILKWQDDVECYGRSAVVSDVDVGGVVLNVDGRSWQELDYIGVRTTEQWINTQGESACQALKRIGRQGLYKVCQRMRGEVQGLYKVCTREDV
jgi:hypothetical protein